MYKVYLLSLHMWLSELLKCEFIQLLAPRLRCRTSLAPAGPKFLPLEAVVLTSIPTSKFNLFLSLVSARTLSCASFAPCGSTGF